MQAGIPQLLRGASLIVWGTVIASSKHCCLADFPEVSVKELLAKRPKGGVDRG